MSNTRALFVFSTLFVAACSQDFQADEALKAPQDLSVEVEMDFDKTNVDVEKLVLLEKTIDGKFIEVELPLQDQSSYRSVAVIADLENGDWIAETDFVDEVSVDFEELIFELSTAGEGELNLLPIDITSEGEVYFSDVVDSIVYAVDSGADLVALSVTATDTEALDAIHYVVTNDFLVAD